MTEDKLAELISRVEALNNEESRSWYDLDPDVAWDVPIEESPGFYNRLREILIEGELAGHNAVKVLAEYLSS